MFFSLINTHANKERWQNNFGLRLNAGASILKMHYSGSSDYIAPSLSEIPIFVTLPGQEHISPRIKENIMAQNSNSYAGYIEGSFL